MFSQKKIATVLAEFLGTAILALVVYTIVARTSFPLFSGLAAGTAIGLASFTMGAFSDAHINPAVTFGLWSLRKIKTSNAIVYIAAQMLGGLAAWALIKYLLGHSITSMAGENFVWKIFVAEALGAFVFLFGVSAAIYQKFEKGRAALIIGGSFFLGVLVASLASNAVLNPAVAVGIQSWNWAYAVAPLVGAVLGANAFALMYVPLSVGKNKSSSKK